MLEAQPSSGLPGVAPRWVGEAAAGGEGRDPGPWNCSPPTGTLAGGAFAGARWDAAGLTGGRGGRRSQTDDALGRRRSRHFLESPAGAARCSQRRTREPTAAAMSHQTGIQGNGALWVQRGRDSREAAGEPGGLRAGQDRSLARSAGNRSHGVSRASAPPHARLSRELPGLRPSQPGPGSCHVADGPEIRWSEGNWFPRWTG